MNKVLKTSAMKVIKEADTKKGFFSEFCIKNYNTKFFAKLMCKLLRPRYR